MVLLLADAVLSTDRITRSIQAHGGVGHDSHALCIPTQVPPCLVNYCTSVQRRIAPGAFSKTTDRLFFQKQDMYSDSSCLNTSSTSLRVYSEFFFAVLWVELFLLGAVTPTRRSPPVRWLLVRIPQAGLQAVLVIYREFILGWLALASSYLYPLWVRRGFYPPPPFRVFLSSFSFFSSYHGYTICEPGRCGV